MAVQRVERWLRDVTAALNAAGVQYSVVGGNAVAAWVSRLDPEATRTTKDVDILVRRDDGERVSAILEGLGFRKENLRGWLNDPKAPSRRSGVHLIWADQRVRPSYALPTPSVDEAEPDPDGFQVLSLAALVRLKLTSFREIDRAHLIDMIQVGLIDDAVRASIPTELRPRFGDIERSAREQELP